MLQDKEMKLQKCVRAVVVRKLSGGAGDTGDRPGAIALKKSGECGRARSAISHPKRSRDVCREINECRRDRACGCFQEAGDGFECEIVRGDEIEVLAVPETVSAVDEAYGIARRLKRWP